MDQELHQYLQAIVQEKTPHIAEMHHPGSFPKVFWEQQQQGTTVKSTRRMRWDPLMIRWCLYLHHLSVGAYELIRHFGMVMLPLQRTLSD